MNNGERYGSMKRVDPRAQELADQTQQPWNIYLAVPEGTAGGWYVLAPMGTLPIGNELEPEGAIKYSHIRCVNPSTRRAVEVSSEALRDQMGADPALFEDDSDSEAFKINMPAELLVEIQHTRIEALERSLKVETERGDTWRQYAGDLEAKLTSIEALIKT